MPTLSEKTAILITAYEGQENLNYILKVLGNEVAHNILQAPKPIPPLKRRVEFGKIQLVLDKQDENYLLALSKYNKRAAIAQRTIQNDTTLQEITYRLLIAKKDVDTANTEADLKTYLEELTNEIAQVTAEEESATIPADETLD